MFVILVTAFAFFRKKNDYRYGLVKKAAQKLKDKTSNFADLEHEKLSNKNHKTLIIPSNLRILKSLIYKRKKMRNLNNKAKIYILKIGDLLEQFVETLKDTNDACGCIIDL